MGGQGQATSSRTTSARSPPTWGPEQAPRYTYARYVNDVLLWSRATDRERTQHSPMAAMQLTGAARLVAGRLLESPEGLRRLQQGDRDRSGNNRSGLRILLHILGTQIAPTETDLSAIATQDLLNLRRRLGESIDQFLDRFTMTRNRAVQRGGIDMAHQELALLLVRSVGLSCGQQVATDVLGSRMPQTEQEFQLVCERTALARP